MAELLKRFALAPDPLAPDGADDVVQSALEAMRAHLGMEVAYLSEFVGEELEFRAVSAPDFPVALAVGDRLPLNETYCRSICDGRLPELIPDTSAEPIAMGFAITRDVPVRSHVSVPIHRGDGSVYGMFCCLSRQANPSLNRRDLDIMRSFAAVTAAQVNGAMAARLRFEAARGRIVEALEGGAFDVVLQPIFELGAALPQGFEALCRFRAQPYRSPDQWFAEAAEVGLALELEVAVIARALEALERLPAHVYVSVNASPATVASGRLEDVFAPHPQERIVLEVTEHIAVDDYEALSAGIARLRARGVRLAIDDAGAGYSGLAHIVRLGPDMIKLDITLTQGVDGDAARQSLVTAMVHYAERTGACIVAEGIETEDDLEALMWLGVHRGQGYALGRPAPIDTAAAWFEAAPAKVA